MKKLEPVRTWEDGRPMDPDYIRVRLFRDPATGGYVLYREGFPFGSRGRCGRSLVDVPDDEAAAFLKRIEVRRGPRLYSSGRYPKEDRP